MPTDFAHKRYWLGPYAVDFPTFWAEVAPSVDGNRKWLKTVMGKNVLFDLCFVPNANQSAADGFLANGVQQYGDGDAHAFNVSHLGRPFRGVRIARSQQLASNAFVEFHTTLHGSDLIGFQFAVLGPVQDGVEAFPSSEDVDKLRLLMLTVVNAAIAKSAVRGKAAPAPEATNGAVAPAATSANEIDLDNFPSGDDPF